MVLHRRLLRPITPEGIAVRALVAAAGRLTAHAERLLRNDRWSIAATDIVHAIPLGIRDRQLCASSLVPLASGERRQPLATRTLVVAIGLRPALSMP
jgi:hypothetical protein